MRVEFQEALRRMREQIDENDALLACLAPSGDGEWKRLMVPAGDSRYWLDRQAPPARASSYAI